MHRSRKSAGWIKRTLQGPCTSTPQTQLAALLIVCAGRTGFSRGRIGCEVSLLLLREACNGRALPRKALLLAGSFFLRFRLFLLFFPNHSHLFLPRGVLECRRWDAIWTRWPARTAGPPNADATARLRASDVGRTVWPIDASREASRSGAGPAKTSRSPEGRATRKSPNARSQQSPPRRRKCRPQCQVE